MQKFHNILFVSQGVADETDALKQALSIARNNKAELKALVVCPELPNEMAKYKDNYELSLKQQLQKLIQVAREATKVSEVDVPVKIELESGTAPAMRIIRYGLRNAHDLVIKETEPKEGDKGFKAMDMELLRKCPCPVWLSRAISKKHNEMRIVVAIDPENIAPEGHDLSLRLLKLSRSLADECNGELIIISCWDYVLEDSLRHSPWIKVGDDELTRVVNEAQNRHRTTLEGLIQKSGIAGKIRVHHVRGDATEIIPQYVTDKNIDVLVMGTVARTGIPGFVIGNTAENIVQKLGCSLLALKPNGFISPIKL